MDLHFVGTANVFAYYPYWKKARSRPRTTFRGVRRVNRSMAYSLRNRIALALRCRCPRKLDQRLLGEDRVGLRQILVRDGANAGWISYMLKDRQKSEFDGFLDCIIIESLHNPIADA